MRSALAWMMSFALLNVISACPVLAHQVPTGHACCEHSRGRDLPCTETSSNNCPYVLLEKSQGKAGVLTLLLATVSSAQREAIRPVTWFTSPNWAERLLDFSGSYLAFRVLLI
jgi:hypothetical protein